VSADDASNWELRRLSFGCGAFALIFCYGIQERGVFLGLTRGAVAQEMLVGGANHAEIVFPTAFFLFREEFPVGAEVF
jgi:hypothetical protein